MRVTELTFPPSLTIWGLSAMIFINNKYTTTYNRIVERAVNRTLSGYSEKHHIIPKSLGGNNLPENIVRLTAQEHLVCHLLLPKMLADTNYIRKMDYAAWQMTYLGGRPRYKVTGKIYEMLKRRMAESYSGMPGRKQTDAEKIARKIRSLGEGNNMYGRKGQDHPAFGKTYPGKGTGKNNSFYGKKHSIESLLRQKEAKLGEKIQILEFLTHKNGRIINQRIGRANLNQRCCVNTVEF